jgi:LacI family transcriptional regulator
MLIRPKADVMMKKASGAETIRDVAQLAGVSTATVSKVLNDAPHVSDESRRRVEDAIRKLNFRPNTIARGLRKSRTHTLGLITDDIEGVFTMSLMRGVEQAAHVKGFSVFLCNSFGDPARERAHLDALLAKQVDGLILLSGFRVRERGAPALPLGGVPVVYLYQYTRDVPAMCYLPDDEGGGYLAAEHLVKTGRRRIAMINGPAKYEATHERHHGYVRALADAGLKADPALLRVGKWHETSGYEATRDLMSLPEPPDAIFCASDSIAIGAMDALHELGVRIPDDVAIIGFDNRPAAPYQRPPLTTIALPLVEMGVQAGEALMRTVTEGRIVEAPTIRRLPCYLVQRRSCGAAPELLPSEGAST